MAIFSNKAEKRVTRRADYKVGLLAATSLEEVEAAKARTRAAEQSAMEIYRRLGAPGTFDTPTSTSMAPTDIFATSGPDVQKSAAARGLLSVHSKLKRDKVTGELIGIKDKEKGKYGYGAETLFDPREGILDPTKYADATGESASFRIQSRQTAEAEQLLKQEGPMWDMLNNSTIGRIYEGAAIQNKEALRMIRDNLAKGGTARRTAFAQAQELIQLEKAHQMRTQETWTANLALHKYIRENADRVQDSNIKFLDNLPELRQSYAQTMNTLSDLLTSRVVPTSMQGTLSSAAGLQAVAAKDGALLEGLIMTGASLVLSGAGAALGGGVSGGGLGSMNTAVAQSNTYTAPTPSNWSQGAQFGPVGSAPETSKWDTGWRKTLKDFGGGALSGAGKSLGGEG